MKVRAIILNSCMILVLQLVYTVGIAQIEYFNLSPEATVYNPGTIGTNYYNLDLNNDGNIDYMIGAEYSETNEFTRTARANYIVKINTDTLNKINPGPYFEGDTLNQEEYFMNFSKIYCILAGNRIIGAWPHIINSVDTYGYIGLEFLQNNNVYFGWVRLKTDGFSFSIDSYAWNKTPGQHIIIGQTE